MQLILLSRGSGKRLWPLSNNARSKQFLPFLEKEDGTMESMVQCVVRQAREARLCERHNDSHKRKSTGHNYQSARRRNLYCD